MKKYTLKKYSTLILGGLFLLSGIIFGLKERTSTTETNHHLPIIKSIQESEYTILQFHAKWCPNCVKQDMSLKAIQKLPRYSKISFIEVDYNKNNALKNHYNVKRQSTFIVFKKGKEIGRKIGLSNQTKIQTYLNEII